MLDDPNRLCGQWSLRRRVADRLNGLTGVVRGALAITREGDAIAWLEHGAFQWRDAAGAWREVPVRRKYLLRTTDGQWWMHFEDGRAFHPWCPDEPVEHPCADDLYQGLVHVDPGCRTMRTLWNVTGPAKDQRLVTRLVRC